MQLNTTRKKTRALPLGHAADKLVKCKVLHHLHVQQGNQNFHLHRAPLWHPVK